MAMPHFLRPARLIAALGALGLVSAGQAQATPPAADPAVPPVAKPATPAPEPTPAPPKHERVMSNAVAATLADGMPKYNPPPKVPEPKPEEESADLRDINKPKNRIIRLPKYVVTEPKPPVFSEREVHSREELNRLALQRYYGLKIGNIGGLNQPTAMFMYEEQERLNTMAGLKDDAKNAKRAGDSAAADYILKETNRAYYRPSDFGWNSDGGGK
jgi:hypothetical protein